jgi:hypothetical protein
VNICAYTDFLCQRAERIEKNGGKQMKLFKWSVILLALLLAAMAMVPIVSAANNYSKEKVTGQPSYSIQQK